jgi:hypothetical protein
LDNRFVQVVDPPIGLQNLADWNATNALPWCSSDVVTTIHNGNPFFENPTFDPNICFVPGPGFTGGGNTTFTAIVPDSREAAQQLRDKVLTDSDSPNEVEAAMYPNPSRGILNIKVTRKTPETLRFIVTDVNGNHILDKVKMIEAGQSALMFLLPSHLSPGIYYVSIFNEQGLFTTKRFVLVE